MDWSGVNFDWNRARAFLVTAEEGSFSAGARALGVAQPTLGRQVAALEQELGVTLFERLGQGLALTDAGQQLKQHVQSMADAASRFALSASGQNTQLEGRVVLAVSELEAVFLLPPGMYGTPEYLASLGQPQRRQDVTEVQLIGFEPDHQLVDYLAPQGWAIGPDNIHLTTLSQLLQLELVKRHLGLAFFPQRIGDAQPLLQRAFEHLGAPLQLPLWLVSHRELRTSPRVRVVFDALVESLADATDATKMT